MFGRLSAQQSVKKEYEHVYFQAEFHRTKGDPFVQRLRQVKRDLGRGESKCSPELYVGEEVLHGGRVLRCWGESILLWVDNLKKFDQGRGGTAPAISAKKCAAHRHNGLTWEDPC